MGYVLNAIRVFTIAFLNYGHIIKMSTKEMEEMVQRYTQ
jgi:hypothetical protein